MRRLLLIFVLVCGLGVGGWALAHRDQIHTPGDFFSLAARQIESARSALTPSQTAGWQSRNRGLIRIASFNTGGLSQNRLSDPHVAIVLEKIITQFDVLALQEVDAEDPWMIQRFLRQLGTDPELYDYVMGLPFVSPSGNSRCGAIIYNRATVELAHDRHYTINDPDQLFSHKPLVAWFQTRCGSPEQAFTFSVVNLQLELNGERNEIMHIGQVFRAVRSDGRGEDDVIVMGDFGVPADQLGRPESGDGLTPLVRYVATSTAGDSQTDNLLIDSLATSEFNGDSGVFDFLKTCNLTLTEARHVSEHLPVWAGFSVTEHTGPGRIASDPSNLPVVGPR